MPLKKGTSRVQVMQNIAELMHSYKKGGSFAKGKLKAKAKEMAIAAAFDLKERSRKK